MCRHPRAPESNFEFQPPVIARAPDVHEKRPISSTKNASTQLSSDTVLTIEPAVPAEISAGPHLWPKLFIGLHHAVLIFFAAPKYTRRRFRLIGFGMQSGKKKKEKLEKLLRTLIGREREFHQTKSTFAAVEQFNFGWACSFPSKNTKAAFSRPGRSENFSQIREKFGLAVTQIRSFRAAQLVVVSRAKYETRSAATRTFRRYFNQFSRLRSGSGKN